MRFLHIMLAMKAMELNRAIVVPGVMFWCANRPVVIPELVRERDASVPSRSRFRHDAS